MNPIEIENLSRLYGRTEAVRGLSFVVPEGSVTALLGPNGAGKTTTIKILMNLIQPTSGIARVLGVDSRRIGPAQFAQIGYISEDQELPMWMTVRQLLDYCRPFYPTWDRDLEKSLLQKFDLPPDRTLKHLSRGMRMKAALLSSLSYRPKLLVLDEPFGGLDPVVRDDVVRGIMETAEIGGWSVLISSHDIAEVEQLVDNVLILQRGRLELSESADSLLGRFRRVDITNAPDSAGPLPGALDWQRNGRVTRFISPDYLDRSSEQSWNAIYTGASISVRTMTLREIFIALVRAEQSTKGAAA